ncbi:MAG: fumarylacetoacetase [Burkholderiaceae bacterium]|nr:fumarylacetoacetase [Burkholderiaceae bacterium]
MTLALNETHDPVLRSWVSSAQAPNTDFPIQNLPYGVFRGAGSAQSAAAYGLGVAIGDQVLSLSGALRVGIFGNDLSLELTKALNAPHLNDFMRLGGATWSQVRLALSRALRTGSPFEAALQSHLSPIAEAGFALPAQIGDYTDFYTSIHHATAVGKLFRPDNPLLPNYKWVPIGYHGRASSIGVSGQRFHRPVGQTMPPNASTPSFAPAKRMDYEMEVGIFIGTGNALGESISMTDAEDHIFGLCLLNDWSARDMQAWEYQPLGPFLAKNFASTISPWVVSLEALAPYRQAWQRDASDPQPLPYLDSPQLRETGAFDVQLEVSIQTKKMREENLPAQRLSLSNFSHSYWTIAQLVAHHTVNGCNLQAGDLLGSGTQSGPLPEEAGSLLELTGGGKQAITLSSGEQRIFIEDEDSIIMRGWAQREGLPRIGFGQVEGRLLAAR